MLTRARRGFDDRGTDIGNFKDTMLVFLSCGVVIQTLVLFVAKCGWRVVVQGSARNTVRW